MKAIWTSHLRPANKTDFADVVNNSMSKAVVDRLKEILTTDLEMLEIETENKRSYDLASWPYYQAHCNGYMEAIRNVLDLFETDLKE